MLSLIFTGYIWSRNIIYIELVKEKEKKLNKIKIKSFNT